MNRESLKKLGSEWKVAINEELDKLKQSDRMLLGDVAAVFARSDNFIGRPEVDCNEENEAYYAIFYPSKTSIVCNKHIGLITNPGSKWKLMSLDEFTEQVFEFHFTYLQLLYNESAVYETDVIRDLRATLNQQVKLEYDKDRFQRKLISLIYGILTAFNKGKFRDEAFCRDRTFLVLKAMQVVDYFELTGKINLTCEIDETQYAKMITNGLVNGEIKAEVLNELNHRAADYSKRLEDNKVKLYNKENLPVHVLELKYKLMLDTVKRVLEQQ